MSRNYNAFIEHIVDEIALTVDNGVTLHDLSQLIDDNVRVAHDSILQDDSDFASTAGPQTLSTFQDLSGSIRPLLCSHPDIFVSVLNDDRAVWNNTHKSAENADDPATSHGSTTLDIKFYATLDRRWKALTGTSEELNRYRYFELQLLSAIVATREHGILQPDLAKATGQDRKIVSDRLKKLQQNGYIVRSAAFGKSFKTNRIFHARFHPETESKYHHPSNLLDLTRKFITHPNATHGNLTQDALFPPDQCSLSDVLQEESGRPKNPNVLSKESENEDVPSDSQRMASSSTTSKQSEQKLTKGYKRARPSEENTHKLTNSPMRNPDNDTVSVEDPPPPAKRRRGRPRKDEAINRPAQDGNRETVKTARSSDRGDNLSCTDSFNANTLDLAAYRTKQDLSFQDLQKRVHIMVNGESHEAAFYSDKFFGLRNEMHSKLLQMSLAGVYLDPPGPRKSGRRQTEESMVAVIKTDRLKSLKLVDSVESRPTNRNSKHNFTIFGRQVTTSDTARITAAVKVFRSLRRVQPALLKKTGHERVSKSYISPAKPMKIAVASKTEASVKKASGRPTISRPDLVIDIIRKAGGVFPGSKEVYYPLLTAIRKQKRDSPISKKNAIRLVQRMEMDGKLNSVVFAFRGHDGCPKTTQLLLLPGVNIDSYAVRTMQTKIIQSDPEPYFPEGPEIDSDLKQLAEIELGKERKTTLANHKQRISYSQTVSTEQQSAAAHDECLNPLPDTENTALEFAFMLDIQKKPKRKHHQAAIPKSSLSLQEEPRLWSVDSADHHSKHGAGLEVSSNTIQPTSLVSTDGPQITNGALRFSKDRKARKLPQLTLETGLQRRFEDQLPSSVDDIFRMRAQKDGDLGLPSSQIQTESFEKQIEEVKIWEMQNEEILASGGSLIQPRFINHTVSADMFPTSDFGDSSSDSDRDSDPSKLQDRNSEGLDNRHNSLIIDQENVSTEEFTPNPNRGRSAGLPSQLRMSKKPKGVRKRYRPIGKARASFTDIRTLAAQQTTPGAAIDSYLVIPRGPRNTDVLTGETLRQFVTAVVIVRSVIGGIERRIDWALLPKLVPDIAHLNLEYRWRRSYVLHKKDIDRLEENFQRVFLAAYESEEVAHVDFDNIEAFDWHWLLNWALNNTEFAVDSQAEVSHAEEAETAGPETTHLPVDFSRSSIRTDVEDVHINARDEFYHSLRPTIHRVDVLNDMAFSVSLKSLKQGVTDSPSPFDISQARSDSTAATMVRANLLTPDHLYNKDVARDRLSAFPEEVLSSVLEDILDTKLFKKQNRGRYVPGRNYGPAELFYVGFRHAFDMQDMFQAAVQFKAKLDDVLARDGYMELPFYWSDAENLALLNLLSNGRIILESVLPPTSTDTTYFNRDEQGNRRLSVWGFTGGGYKTAKIERSELVFPLRVRASDSYVREIPLPNPLPPIPGPPPVSTAGVQRIPVWYSIHNTCLYDIWNMLLAVVVTMTALRPGYGPAEISRTLKNGVAEWEIELVYEWLDNIGAARRVCRGSGWTAGEWWWTVFGAGANTGAGLGTSR